jgi:DNA-binding NtrC family response regulator
MIRPCFLVIDRESSSAISTRKLVIETAKFNVLTAYSSDEAIETLRKYPALDGVVADTGLADMSCDNLIAELKKIHPKIPVIVVNTPRGIPAVRADYNLDSFDPKQLLALLETLQPEATAQIAKRNEYLEEKYYKT